MSLSGIVNTHTIAAHLDRAPRHRGAEAALAAAPRDRRAARLPLALGGRRRQRHAQHRVPRGARRRRVRRSTARSSGSPTASAPASSRSPRAPTKASRASSSRRSPARRAAASRSARTSEARLQGHRDRRDVVRRPPRPGRLAARRSRPRARLHPRRARGRPHQHRGARAVGVARAAFDAALAYAQERATFGKPIARAPGDPDEARRHGDASSKRRACSRATRPSASRPGERADVEAGMAKLFASETAFELATESMRIHGGVGYTTELPVERYYRDAPLMIIGEGTNEIQRLVIARGLLARAERSSDIVIDVSPAVVASSRSLPLVFVGCGGDDSDGSDERRRRADPTRPRTTTSPPSRRRSPIPRRGFGATAEQADCVARRVVDEIGADRLQDAGLTRDLARRDDRRPRPSCTAEEADSIVDAFFDCYRRHRYATSAARRRTGRSPRRSATCVGEVDDAADVSASRRCCEGSDAQLTEAEADGFVDTLLVVRPDRRGLPRQRRGAALAITDEQVDVPRHRADVERTTTATRSSQGVAAARCRHDADSRAFARRGRRSASRLPAGQAALDRGQRSLRSS